METNDVVRSSNAVVSSKQRCNKKASTVVCLSSEVTKQSIRTNKIQHHLKKRSPLHSNLNTLAELLSPKKKNCEKTKLYRNRFAKKDSYGALINLMKRSDTHPNMICTCHRIIQNSVICMPIELCNDLIYQMDIMTSIVFNMKQFPSNLNVQRTGCAVLDSLIQSSQHAEYFIISQDLGLHVILNAMKRFPIHNEIQKNGCNLIWFCTELTTNMQLLLLHDTIPVLKNITLNHNNRFNNDLYHKSSKKKSKKGLLFDEITYERAESALFVLQQCTNYEDLYYITLPKDDVDQLLYLGSKILKDMDHNEFTDSFLSSNTNMNSRENINDF